MHRHGQTYVYAYVYIYIHIYICFSLCSIFAACQPEPEPVLCSIYGFSRAFVLICQRSAVFAAFPELHLQCFTMLAARQLYFETLTGPRKLQMLFCTTLQPNRSQAQTLKQEAYGNKQRHPSLTPRSWLPSGPRYACLCKDSHYCRKRGLCRMPTDSRGASVSSRLDFTKCAE